MKKMNRSRNENKTHSSSRDIFQTAAGFDDEFRLDENFRESNEFCYQSKKVIDFSSSLLFSGDTRRTRMIMRTHLLRLIGNANKSCNNHAHERWVML